MKKDDNDRADDADALEASITHWESLSQARHLIDIEAEGIDPDDCALCQLDDLRVEVTGSDCVRCVIAEHVGATNCKNTPYEKAYRAYRALVLSGVSSDIDAFQSAALDELEFLKSLREA